ncbi:glycosyltransferase [Streptomyces sp. NPDC006529]|uniref:glycosyltransferase n=1 Tax=Streptomyces sp. NPDC006529 TaxID=3157177 RepID=UPI0033A8DAD7
MTSPIRPVRYRPGRPRPLSIALVSEHASPLATLGGVDAGGQNVHVAALAGALADRGHRVVVYTRRDDPGLPERTRMRARVEVRHVPAGPAEPIPKDELLPHMRDFAYHLINEWQAGAPDLVHAHYWMSGVASLIAAREHHVPLLHTYHALGSVKKRHQGSSDTSPAARITLEKDIGLRCDRVIATCRDEVRELGLMGIYPEKSPIVPCGVDPKRFRPVDSAAEHRPGRPYRLLHLGRLVPRKGAALSIAALARLPGAELLIAGGPPADRLDGDPEVRRLRALALGAGVLDRVRFLGAVPGERVPALLGDCDVVLCPADYEPFGIVPLEAMACGRPVVASAVGGQLDTVAHGETGLLVPPGDAAALTRAVALLLDDPARRLAYGEAGRRRVLGHYGWDRVAAATEAVYRSVLTSRFSVAEPV